MEVPIQAAPVATTPGVSQPIADVGQPMQQMGGMPEGLAPEGQAPEVAPQEEFFLKAGTGTVYKTMEAAVAGVEAKDQYIEQLKSLLAMQAQPQVQQPQVDPKAAANTAIAQLQAEFEQDLRSDPRFQGASPDAIADEAYIQAKAAYRVEQRMMQQYEQRQQKQLHEQFIQNTPELKTDVARQVYDRYVQQYGITPIDPQHHLTLVHAEMYRLQQSGQAPSVNTGVNGAVQYQQNAQQRIFSNANGGGLAPQAMSDTVRKQVEFAQSRGYSGEQLERIKQRAIEGESRMVKR